MEIAARRVAAIHYTLTNDAGEVIDKSRPEAPLTYLHGAGNIVPGLERRWPARRPATAWSPTWCPRRPTARATTA